MIGEILTYYFVVYSVMFVFSYLMENLVRNPGAYQAWIEKHVLNRIQASPPRENWDSGGYSTWICRLRKRLGAWNEAWRAWWEDAWEDVKPESPGVRCLRGFEGYLSEMILRARIPIILFCLPGIWGWRA